MDVRLLSWAYVRIRGGLDGVDVNLGSPPARWTLIQMPNGMGKTTTMQLLRATLSGATMDEDTVRSFRPTEQTREGSFELVLTIDGQVYRLTTTLDYDRGTVMYETARAATTGGGRQPGHLLPRELQSLLSPEFTKLFIFDGELARQIRNLRDERASRAIRTLFRLDKLVELQAQIDHIVSMEQQKPNSATRAKSVQGVKALATRLESSQEALKTLESQEAALTTQLATARQQLATLEREVHEHVQQGEQFRTRANQLTLDRADIDKALIECAKRTLAELRNPAAIHNRVVAGLGDLGGKMQKLKLPKTMSTEFFYELAEGSTCICGREIGTDEAQTIRERAMEYLSADQISVINEIKSAVRQFKPDEDTFTNNATELTSLIKRQQRLRGDWERLQAERVAAGDEELERIRTDRDSVREEIERLSNSLEALTCAESSLQRRHRVDEQTNIPLCRTAIEDRRRALAEATDTVALLNRANVTKDILSRIESTAMALITDRLRSETNRKLASLISGERIRVSKIGGALELESDVLESKQHVSEGQSLAIAYAFLTSLFEQAPYSLPFVVDSPAGSLDLEVRREVAELVPDLFNQLVMFLISSERDAFADPFYARTGVNYRTIWRDPNGRTRTDDTLEKFKHFHSEEGPTQGIGTTGNQQ